MLRLRFKILAALVASLGVVVALLPSVGMVPSVYAAPPAINISNNAKLGNILTDGSGMTLYVFKSDKAGQSTCTGGCAQTWPPFAVNQGEQPTSGAGVTGKVAIIDRADGTYQVTYEGMPLYTYSGDTKAGDANGNGIGGVWTVLAATSPSGSASPSGYQGQSSKSTAKSYSKSKSNYGSYGSYGMNYGGYGMNYGYMYRMPYGYAPYRPCPCFAPRVYFPARPPFPYFRSFPRFQSAHPFYGWGNRSMMRPY